jgi:hypothetical protein
MSRKQFAARNNIGSVLTFQKSGSTSSFDPDISFSSSSRRVSWKLNNGSEIIQTAGNSITYTGFTSDTGIRTIEMRGNSFSGLNQFILDGDNLYGNLNLPLSGLGGDFRVQSNSGLTGITHVPSSEIFSLYYANNCNLTGNLNVPFSGLGGDFWVQNNPNLTGITHVPSTQIFTSYFAYNCNLTGNLNVPLSGLGGGFWVYYNPNLTGITHVPSSQFIGAYLANNCNLTGNLNLPFYGLGGQFSVNDNPNLTGITHVPSSEIFSLYYANNCNLTGNLNLPLSGLGGDFRVYGNTGLTSVTHVSSSQIFTNYLANNCNLTGNLNLPFSGLGIDFKVNNNPNLTGITHVSSSQNFLIYNANNCNLTGTLDLSPLTNLGYNPIDNTYGEITLHYNPNLTNIIFPNSTQSFRNGGTTSDAFSIYSCNLGYVDFKPLSGATLVSGATAGIPRIKLQDNNMTTSEVNHILVDFSGNATYNQTGWSNINLDIGGTNDAPDSGSGGYNGLDAISFLTGSPRNWIITT